MRDPFDCILLFLTGLVLWMWILSGPPVKADETPPQRMEDISYCWAQQHNVYLPCMYSSKEYEV